MRDYPNMSYCMFNNTLLAMEQINEFITEGDPEELVDVRDEELAKAQELYYACKEYLSLYKDMVRIIENYEEEEIDS